LAGIAIISSISVAEGISQFPAKVIPVVGLDLADIFEAIAA
jgi:hypothetical protein